MYLQSLVQFGCPTCFSFGLINVLICSKALPKVQTAQSFRNLFQKVKLKVTLAVPNVPCGYSVGFSGGLQTVSRRTGGGKLYRLQTNRRSTSCISPLFQSESKCIHTQILVHLHVNKTYFHMKGVALGLALKQRRKATRKLPILKTLNNTLLHILLKLIRVHRPAQGARRSSALRQSMLHFRILFVSCFVVVVVVVVVVEGKGGSFESNNSKTERGRSPQFYQSL